VICGSFWGKTGPVDGVAADPRYLDIFVPPGVRRHLRVETTRNAFAYVFEGSGRFRDGSEPREAATDRVGIGNPGGGFADVANRFLVLFDQGDEVVVVAGDNGIRFLLVSGEPIQEPVAWHGPIVMNTQEQLRQAYSELRSGTFIK
jgi:redox-sensitive bicupin YhaK (pirin superfamily)